MGRFSRRIVVELTERDYHRLLKAGERHRRSPQHQAGVFIEDALNADEIWPQSVTGPQTTTATDLRLPVAAATETPMEAAGDKNLNSINERGDHVEGKPLNGDPYVALQAASEPTGESTHIPSDPSVWPSFRNEPPTSNQPLGNQADSTESTQSDAPAWGVDTATDEDAETNPLGGVSVEAPKRTARSRR